MRRKNQKLQVILIFILALCIIVCRKERKTDRKREISSEDGIEESARGLIEGGLEESEKESEHSVPDNVIEAYLTESIEYVDEVIPVQYVDDLSLLANLKYTDGTYVYQDGKVYYRRYHEDS